MDGAGGPEKPGSLCDGTNLSVCEHHEDALARRLTSISVASWRDLDLNNGRRYHEHFSPLGVWDFAGERTIGRDAIRARFDARRRNGERSTLHMVTNFGWSAPDPERRVLSYYVCVFGADGAAVQDVRLPTLLGTVRDEFSRHPDGEWLISLREFRPVFSNPDDRVGRRVTRSLS